LLAALKDIDLVVVGTSGQTGLEKAALGSTAEAIFRSSPVPVLTVGPCCRYDSQETVLNAILYATDFSPGAKLSLPYASSIANEHAAKLILLHVSNDKEAEFSFERTIASIKPLERLNELIGEDLDQFIAEGADAKFKVTGKVGFGKPGTVIVEEAMKAKADLIVIGARGTGAFASVLSHFGGGTAYHVAVNADCPVLTIRRP
jgi:nucleotide-binding universal stress UspA family protein